jgi:hypothetical protein
MGGCGQGQGGGGGESVGGGVGLGAAPTGGVGWGGEFLSSNKCCFVDPQKVQQWSGITGRGSANARPWFSSKIRASGAQRYLVPKRFGHFAIR